MREFRNAGGGPVLMALVRAVQDHKQALSDIDGATGDGDHGINLNKGFTIFSEQFIASNGNLSQGLEGLSSVLLTKIGGAIGPLYGAFFRGMAAGCQGADTIDEAIFGKMLVSAREAIGRISMACEGDKTLLDALIPAEEAFRSAVEAGRSFPECLQALSVAAVQGRDRTKDMVARVGRASRLGDRSRGAVDAGAASCCLILESLAQSIMAILSGECIHDKRRVRR